jgi:hypothetical protein
MSDQTPATLNIEISVEDASAEELDDITRGLLNELRDTDVESARLRSGGAAPKGTKAVDPVTIGSIAIAVLPAVLPKLLDFLKEWASRGQGRSIKFKGKVGGQDIEFEGTNADLQKLIAMLKSGSTS